MRQQIRECSCGGRNKACARCAGLGVHSPVSQSRGACEGPRIPCPVCGRRVHPGGLGHHARAKYPEQVEEAPERFIVKPRSPGGPNDSPRLKAKRRAPQPF
jgi:hypothetical protein